MKKVVKNTLKCLKWIVICVVALAGLLTAYFYIGGIEWGDWSIPDEAELRLEKVKVPDEDNAYIALIALTNLYHVTEGDYDSTEISDKRFVNYYGNPFFTDGDNDEREKWAAARRDQSSPKRAEKILADHAKFFEAFRTALSLKGYLADFDEEVRSIWPNEDFKPFMSYLGALKPFIDFARLVGLKAQLAFECGDSETAVAAIGNIHTLGQIIATNCGHVCFGDIYDGYAEWGVGNLIKGIAYKKMCDAIAMGKATGEMLEVFSKMINEDEVVAAANRKRVIKAEFTNRAKCVDWYSRSYSTDLLWGIIDFNEHDANISTRCEFDPFSGRQTAWSDRFAMFKIRAKAVAGLMLLHWPGCREYILHRRETLFRIAEIVRTAIAGKELHGGSVGDAVPFSRNAFGSFLVDGIRILCNSIGDVANTYSLARTRTRLILSAEKWRRAHGGKNPPTLDALVPDYLAAVPRDPWSKSGEPIKYDAALGVVWSVGKKRQYDYRKAVHEALCKALQTWDVDKDALPLDSDTQEYAFRLDGQSICSHGSERHCREEMIMGCTISPEMFRVMRADFNPVRTTCVSWKLQLLSDTLDVNATQIQNNLKLICEPADKVSGEIASVKSLSGGEKGFLVTVDNVCGEGKMGLSYEGLPPMYYDVKLRRMWLVPIANCRSAMKGRYDSAVFFSGMERGLSEGTVISPSDDKCGYRILSISDYCVWFEAFYGDTPPEDILPHSIWPDFSHIDTMPPAPPPGKLMHGQRDFRPGEAIWLPSLRYYLFVDDLLKGRGVVFRLLDSSMRPVRDLLCVIVREEK